MRARPALLATCLFAACISARPADVPAADTGGNEASAERASSIIILVVRRKWHVDVGFAVRDLGPPLAPVARRFPDARYLFFGFGDQHYLLSKKEGSPAMLGAVLPGPGLMLVTAIGNTPQQAFGAGHVLGIETAAADARTAQSFIRRSFQGDEAAETVEPYATGPYEGSLYFSAVYRYSALHTCNTWAAEALRSAGLKVRTRGVIFAAQIWSQARRLAASAELEGVPALNAPPAARVLLQSQGGGLPF